VLEHVTTREAAEFVAAAGANVAATITPQHLMWSRNAMLVGGVRPHFYCLPILKRETHRRALVAAATSGSPKVLPRAPIARPMRATRRSTHADARAATRRRSRSSSTPRRSRTPAALDRLEGFASLHGASSTGCRRTSTR
jgi:dihydroorotase